MIIKKSLRAGQQRRVYATDKGAGKRLEFSVLPENGADLSGVVFHTQKDHFRSHPTMTQHALKPENSLKLGYTARDIEVSITADQDAMVTLSLEAPSWAQVIIGNITGAAMALSGAYLDSAVQENQFI